MQMLLPFSIIQFVLQVCDTIGGNYVKSFLRTGGIGVGLSQFMCNQLCIKILEAPSFF